MFEKRGVSKEFAKKVTETIINLHEQIISASGGISGVRDEGGIYLEIYKFLNLRQKNKSEPLRIAAVIYRNIARRQYFRDGNKRTAHIFAKQFLLTENFHLKLHYNDAIPFVLEIAQEKVTLNQIKEWLENNTNSISLQEVKNIIPEKFEELSDNPLQMKANEDNGEEFINQVESINNYLSNSRIKPANGALGAEKGLENYLNDIKSDICYSKKENDKESEVEEHE